IDLDLQCMLLDSESESCNNEIEENDECESSEHEEFINPDPNKLKSTEKSAVSILNLEMYCNTHCIQSASNNQQKEHSTNKCVEKIISQPISEELLQKITCAKMIVVGLVTEIAKRIEDVVTSHRKHIEKSKILSYVHNKHKMYSNFESLSEIMVSV